MCGASFPYITAEPGAEVSVTISEVLQMARPFYTDLRNYNFKST